jgi:uncharacterized RDD family membrane protein YckC
MGDDIMVSNNAVKVQRETLTVEMPVRLKRICAGFIDLVIVSCIQIWVSSIFGIIDPTGSRYLMDGDGMSGVVYRSSTMDPWWLYLTVFIYFFVQEALFCTTIGKRLVGLHVVEIHGRRISLVAVFIRNLFRFLDALPFFYLVGLVSGTISPAFQRVGDRVARTTVMPVKMTPFSSLSWKARVRNYFGISLLIVLFVSFCLKYSYYDRPPLVIESWKNINNSYTADVVDSTNSRPTASVPPCGKLQYVEGDYQLNRHIELVSLGTPLRTNDEITYPVVYEDKVRCNALVSLHWQGFLDGGWKVDRIQLRSGQ